MAAELDILLDTNPEENLIALEERANPKQDVLMQTDEAPTMTRHYTTGGPIQEN